MLWFMQQQYLSHHFNDYYDTVVFMLHHPVGATNHEVHAQMEISLL